VPLAPLEHLGWAPLEVLASGNGRDGDLGVLGDATTQKMSRRLAMALTWEMLIGGGAPERAP
jgi:hypothetical protein